MKDFYDKDRKLYKDTATLYKDLLYKNFSKKDEQGQLARRGQFLDEGAWNAFWGWVAAPEQ